MYVVIQQRSLWNRQGWDDAGFTSRPYECIEQLFMPTPDSRAHPDQDLEATPTVGRWPKGCLVLLSIGVSLRCRQLLRFAMLLNKSLREGGSSETQAAAASELVLNRLFRLMKQEAQTMNMKPPERLRVCAQEALGCSSALTTPPLHAPGTLDDR